MSVTRPWVVVTHWVHPEVAGYLAGFCDALIPSQEEGAWPRDEPVRRHRRDHGHGPARPGDRPPSGRIRGRDHLSRRTAPRRRDRAGTGRLVPQPEQAAAASDVLIAALPLNTRTRHLVNAELIGRMRPGAFVVNVGRGSVVDEDAVAGALDAGRLGGYAADVFAMEDWLLPGRPSSIPDRLLRHPRTLFTPHLGSAVDDVRCRMSLQAARQVRQVLEGRHPDHAVNLPQPVRPGAPR